MTNLVELSTHQLVDSHGDNEYGQQEIRQSQTGDDSIGDVAQVLLAGHGNDDQTISKESAEWNYHQEQEPPLWMVITITTVQFVWGVTRTDSGWGAVGKELKARSVDVDDDTGMEFHHLNHHSDASTEDRLQEFPVKTFSNHASTHSQAMLSLVDVLLIAY